MDENNALTTVNNTDSLNRISDSSNSDISNVSLIVDFRSEFFSSSYGN
jgi:hypothetical protein